MRLARLLALLCVSLCAALPARADTAGQVLAAVGDVLALRAGRIVRLFPGAPVEPGDQIHTGADGSVQLRFTDWGMVWLRPRSDLVVDEYVYEARHGGREKASFSLIKGGVRSITGLVGRRDRANYLMRVRPASIGIRGTDFTLLFCNNDCKDSDGALGANGLYGGVTEGRIAVSPYGGRALEREFGAGEFFHLVDENSVPAPLFSPPSHFLSKLDPQARPGGSAVAGIPPTLPGTTVPLPPGVTDPVSSVTGGLTRVLASTLPVSPVVSVKSLPGSTVNTILPPVTVPTLPPVTAPTLPPVTAPTLPPVTVPTLPPVTVPSLPLSTGAIAPLRR